MSDRVAQDISVHVPRMYRVALRVVADADQAHDVVQEACLKALAKLDTFDGRAEMSTWLHRITVNCARDALRRDHRRRQAQDRLQDAAADPASRVATPAETAEQREMQALAWQALAELPEECREAFALTQLDGYSYDEAAAIEGEPRGTIASRVHRAKQLLLQEVSARTNRRAEQ